MLYWLLKHVLVGPWVRLSCRPVVTGREHVPARGPVIVAANHLAEIDSLVLGLVVPRRITFVAKAEYFTRGPVRGRFYGTLCRATGQIPVDRRGGEAAAAALAAARSILDAGGVWAIYPEGTRSRDGLLHRGHTGVMRVALAHPDAVVLPVGIAGTPVDGTGRRRGRVRVRIGGPMELATWRETPDDPHAWRAATDLLMKEIQELSGQEYVDRY